MICLRDAVSLNVENHDIKYRVYPIISHNEHIIIFLMIFQFT